MASEIAHAKCFELGPSHHIYSYHQAPPKQHGHGARWGQKARGTGFRDEPVLTAARPSALSTLPPWLGLCSLKGLKAEDDLSSGLLNLMWDGVLVASYSHIEILPNIPDQVKETSKGQLTSRQTGGVARTLRDATWPEVIQSAIEHTHTHTYIYLFMTCMYMNIHIHIHMYTYIYIYTYTHEM